MAVPFYCQVAAKVGHFLFLYIYIIPHHFSELSDPHQFLTHGFSRERFRSFVSSDMITILMIQEIVYPVHQGPGLQTQIWISCLVLTIPGCTTSPSKLPSLSEPSSLTNGACSWDCNGRQRSNTSKHLSMVLVTEEMLDYWLILVFVTIRGHPGKF